MNVREARALARRWIEEQSGDIPGFMGAFFVGSTNFTDGDAPMPPTSDVDIAILVDREERSLRKLAYHGIVIEASITPADRILQSAEAVLGDFRYACHLAKPNILAEKARHAEEYVQWLALAGMETQEACERREDILRDLTPELMRAAEVIMDRNPEIRD